MVEKRHFDLIAASYSQSCNQGLWGFLKRREAQALTPHLKTEGFTHVLDYGCGTGYYSEIIQKLNPSAQLVGVDSSKEMIAQYNKMGFLGIPGTVENLEHHPQFDFILIAGVLEFVEDPKTLIETVMRKLKNRGQLVLLAPQNVFLNCVYKFYHFRRGTKIHLHPIQNYIEEIKKHGGHLVFSQNPTPFSTLKVFTRQ